MMIRTLSVAFFALLLVGGPAYSADFADVDSDDDGKISKTEFSDMVKDFGRGSGERGGDGRPGGSGGDRLIQAFTKADTDGDGYLSPSEFLATKANRGSRRIDI